MGIFIFDYNTKIIDSKATQLFVKHKTSINDMRLIQDNITDCSVYSVCVDL